MSNAIRMLAVAIFLALIAPATAAPIGIVESWDLFSAVQNLTLDSSQVFDRATVVQSPFSANQHAQIGSSFANTYLNVTIDDQNLVLVIQPEHFCEKTATVRPRCLTTGILFLTPTVDVMLTASGSYTYHLGGDPVGFSGGISGSDYTNGTFQFLLFSDSQSVNSFQHPSNATLNFSTGGLLLAGRRYRIEYQFISSAYGMSPPIGSVVSGQGGIVITAHPVPEPAAIGSLALAGIALVRKRRPDRFAHRRVRPDSTCPRGC